MTEKEAFDELKVEYARVQQALELGPFSLEAAVQRIIPILRELENELSGTKKSTCIDRASMLRSRLRNEILDASNARREARKKGAAQKREVEYQNAIYKAVDAVRRDLDMILQLSASNQE